MRALLFLLILPLLPLSCFKNRIHYSYDEFENKQKMMMEQVYSARKDFNRNQRVSIKYYKEVNRNGAYSISGKIYFQTYPSEGRLKPKLSIKVRSVIYETHFYDDNAERISNIITETEHTIDYEDKEPDSDKEDERQISSETYTNTTTTNTYINNIAYFNLGQNVIDHFLINENLSFRFYNGKEGVTIYLSKNQIKAMQKFIQTHQ